MFGCVLVRRANIFNILSFKIYSSSSKWAVQVSTIGHTNIPKDVTSTLEISSVRSSLVRQTYEYNASSMWISRKCFCCEGGAESEGSTTHLRNTRAAGVWGEHSHERRGKRGEHQRPRHVKQVRDEVRPGALARLTQDLGPRPPLKQHRDSLQNHR